MNNNQTIMLILVILFSFIVGYFVGRRVCLKEPEGEIKFVIQNDGDGTDLINCVVTPDVDWDEVMAKRDILFRITKDSRIEEAIRR